MLHSDATVRQGAGPGGFSESLLAPVYFMCSLAFLELLAYSGSASCLTLARCFCL